jgi:hypothetical protein
MKIFCIGLNKTGTSSLHRALQGLGLTSQHFGGPPIRKAVERAIREDKPLLTYLPEADAYSDIQRLSVNYERLDREYPGSKFILTLRDVDGWIDSRRRHVERNIERKAAGEYDGTFLEIEPDEWRALFEDHHRGVAEYFAGRDDFLEFRVTEGDGYEKLCPFLGMDIPEAPFPWKNRDVSLER